MVNVYGYKNAITERCLMHAVHLGEVLTRQGTGNHKQGRMGFIGFL